MMLEAALALRARGLSVIPIPSPRPGVQAGHPGDGKVPALAWTEYQRRLPTEKEVRAWFRQPMNIAVVTGAVSDAVVVDADSPEALRWATRRLPYTPWQTQTSKGYHLWYRHPGVHVPNRARIETREGRIAIDVRGDGGFVITAPSLHASGARYREAGDWSEPRERVPRFWPGWLARPTRPTALAQRMGPRPEGNIVDRARRYLAATPLPEIGKGSDVATLAAACRLVRGFALAEGEACALLWEWAGGRPGWTQEWVAAKVAHAVRYGSEPIGAYR